MRAAAVLLALGLLAGCSDATEDAAGDETRTSGPTSTTSAVPRGTVPSAGCGADPAPEPGVTDERLTSGGTSGGIC